MMKLMKWEGRYDHGICNIIKWSKLLSLERNAVPISKEIFDLLDKTLSSISNEYLLNHFSEKDVSIMKADIQVAKSVINYYKKPANFD